MFHYRLFGLVIGSEIELPELDTIDACATVDVFVRHGDVPHADDVTPADIVIEQEVGRFGVAGGREIVIQPNPGVPERNVRLYLLGSAMGAILHQRGLVPLHANAVQVNGRAFAFLGKSGEGKSTLAAWFYDRGYRILSDDVCVVRFRDGDRPFTSAGLPRLRLWRDSLEASGRDPSDYALSYTGDSEWEKYDVPLEGRPEGDCPLAAVYLLARGQQFGIQPLNGAAAAEAIMAHTYRGAFVRKSGQLQEYWSDAVKLAAAVPIYTVARTGDFAHFSEEAEAMLAHLTGHARSSA